MRNIYSIILSLCLVVSLSAQTRIREGTQTQGALPTAQGGAPSGGSTGQALTKTSNTSYDYAWSTLVTTFLGLTDTPSSYASQSLKSVRVNAGETALEFFTPSAGATTFLALTDTPSSYGSQSLKAVRVNSGETALEFYTPSSTIVRGFSFGLKRTSGVSTGKLPMYWTCPYSGTISAWNITVDAGTITVKVWKKATGTVHPTSSDSINTSGIALSTGTSIHSTTLSDFTTLVVTAGDIFAVEVTASSGVFDLGGSIEITQSL